MKLERLWRRSKQVGVHESKPLLAHVHLRELVREAGDPWRLVGWALAESWCVDVFRLRWCTSIVRGLRWRTHLLLLRELALRCKTRREKLRGMSGLTRDRAICGCLGGQSLRAIICLSLTSRILSTLSVVGLRRGRRARGLRHGRINAFGIGERRLPLRPSGGRF